MPAAAKTGDWFIRLGADDTTKVPVKQGVLTAR